jgi:hypothetical protein
MTTKDYVKRVEWQLRDLPWKARRDLMRDLHGHLNELPDGQDAYSRFGAPESYAYELRAAAQLDPRRGLLGFLRARRPRNLLLAALVVATLGFVFGGLVWLSKYQPLRTGHISMDPQPSHTDALGETVATIRGQAPFRYGFSIQNVGRFSVRILDIPMLHDGTELPFSARAFVSAPVTYRGPEPEPNGFRAFRPFDLGSGEERVIELRGAYAKCRENQRGLSLIYDGFAIEERFHTWTHTVRVPLSEPLVIRYPQNLRC